jgi:DNA-binding LytR/AlgR family response regulator
VLISYIIIDFLGLINQNLSDFESFENFICLGYCKSYESVIDTILEKKPQVIFFNVSDEIPFSIIYEFGHFLDIMPYIIVVNKEKNNAYSALKHGASDYLLFPIQIKELRKSLLKITKLTNIIDNKKICIRSNGDHHFMLFEEIVYMKADNNTTDFYLQNGGVVPGFKTMKFYESQLPVCFFRIHNSYIVNINFISRINFGKLDCYLLNNTVKIPFSRTYKNLVELIIKQIT